MTNVPFLWDFFFSSLAALGSGEPIISCDFHDSCVLQRCYYWILLLTLSLYVLLCRALVHKVVSCRDVLYKLVFQDVMNKVVDVCLCYYYWSILLYLKGSVTATNSTFASTLILLPWLHQHMCQLKGYYSASSSLHILIHIMAYVLCLYVILMALLWSKATCSFVNLLHTIHWMLVVSASQDQKVEMSS